MNLVTLNASIGFSGGPYSFISASIPIFWPFTVNVSLSAGFGATATLAVGYDTYGFREALAQLQSGNPTAGQLASDIGDGFYISQTAARTSPFRSIPTSLRASASAWASPARASAFRAGLRPM